MTNLNPRGQDANGNLVFLPYDPKAPITENGRRTAKVMYKIAKTGENAGIKKGNNVCMLVPPFSPDDVTPQINKLMPHIITMLEVEQDKLIKAAHTSDDVTLSPAEISLDAIITALEAERVSGRMSKEVITAWFDEYMSDTLTVLFADKLGISSEPTQAQADKIDSLIAVYKAKYCGLASNLVNYAIEEAEKLVVAMDKCEVGVDVNADGDIIGARIRERLEKMAKPADMTALLDL